MHKMGGVLVNKTSDFVDMLETADVNASIYDSPELLIEKYVDELPQNDDLQMMSAYMIEKHDSSSFDGKIENEDVYRNYEVFYHHWNPESQSNVVGAIAGALGAGANLGSKIVDQRTQKKYGAINLASQKAQAKTALIQSVIQQKQAKAEKDKALEEQKTQRTKYWLIGGGVLVGLIAIGVTIYFVRKK